MKKILLISFLIVFFSLHPVFAKPVKPDKALKAAKTFLKTDKLREQKKLIKVTTKQVQNKISQKQLNIGEIKEICCDDGKVLAYVTELEPEGYIIISADDKIRPIIGYSLKGKFPFEDSKQNVLLHLVQWDMEARLEVLNSNASEINSLAQSNGELWNMYTSSNDALLQPLASSSQTSWPDPVSYGHDGWIKTHWAQDGWIDFDNPQHGFNEKCPLDPHSGSNRCLVGCVATAMAQIVNYWEYPSSVHFDESDSYTYLFWRKLPPWTQINIDNGSMTLDFPNFQDLSSYTISYDLIQQPDYPAWLSFMCGIKLQMNYSEDASGTRSQSNAYLSGFGYGSAVQVRGFLNTAGCWTKNKNIVIDNIKKGWPVQIDAIRLISLKGGGHSLIIDGYKETGEFHLNFGWGGLYDNLWYWLPDIDSNPSYDTIIRIIYNIHPYQSWSQWGADEKNSFSTVYSAPTAENEPITNKWYVTSDSVYTFSGLVVGTGNKIYASCIPDTGGYHPSVWVFSQYGVKEKEITINEETNSITYPVQNSSGEVFVGANSGKVYRINPKDDSYVEIFDTGGPLSHHNPLKIDSDGRIYVCTQYNLYCLSRTGSEYWSFSTPSIDHFFFRKVPAIDVQRDRVYIDYHNPYTDIAYLTCINRITGTEIHTKSVSGIATGFNSFSIPSIGPDGTVYVGCYSNLYALNPDSSLSEKWNKNLFPTYVDKPPAIGSNGNIYTTHWNDLGGGNYSLYVGARDSSNGNVKWEVPAGSDGTEDSVDEIYVSGNDVVSFWFSDNTGGTYPNHTIKAYRDNGDSSTFLWQEYFGQNGGKTAFGPGATLYVVSSTLAGNTIYALSDGSVGDPDGGGMAYTNNESPAMPFNPSPMDEAQNIGSIVSLSWECSDPEAHALEYSLFVGESGYDMVPIATDLNDTSYELTGLKPGTGYAWKIIATDGQAVSEGPSWVFSTESINPDINRDKRIDFLDF